MKKQLQKNRLEIEVRDIARKICFLMSGLVHRLKKIARNDRFFGNFCKNSIFVGAWLPLEGR